MKILISGINGFVGTNFTKSWGNQHVIYGLDIHQSEIVGVVEQLLGDPTKARTLLGWNPTKTSFPELVKIMVAHDMRFVRKLKLKADIDDEGNM